jgi:hypothetical protein
MTTIRATNPASFLSLVPHLLGCTPRESLVLVPFAGSRSVGAMRLDLPAASERHVQAAHVVAGLVCRVPDADGLVAIIYTAQLDASAADLIEEIGKQAHACGLDVRDALYVTEDGYGRIGEPAQPLSDLESLEVNGQPANTGDQHTASALPAPDAALLDAALTVDVSDALSDRETFRECVERIATGAPIDAELFAFALVACERPAARDMMLVGVVSGAEATGTAWDAQMAWQNGADYPAELARVMWGEGARPDVDRLRQLQETLRRLVASEQSMLPGSLATLAWVSWALGQSTAAADFAQASLDIDPRHGLAGIVSTMVDAGHLPGWAFGRR